MGTLPSGVPLICYIIKSGWNVGIVFSVPVSVEANSKDFMIKICNWGSARDNHVVFCVISSIFINLDK